MDIAHRQKVGRLIEEVGRQGVHPYTVAPPLFRLLWALGLEVPPPLFLGFRKIALLMGTFFGLVWGVLYGISMWLLVWQGEISAGVVVSITAFAAMGAGLLFGVFMAWYTRRTAARLGLPSSWEEYPQD